MNMHQCKLKMLSESMLVRSYLYSSKRRFIQKKKDKQLFHFILFSFLIFLFSSLKKKLLTKSKRPGSIFEDPVKHRSIEVENAIVLEENQVILVSR